jgi:hypothetical protein
MSIFDEGKCLKLVLRGLGDHGGYTEQVDFDPANCSVRVSVDIGVDGQEWANYFHVQVVTLEFLTSVPAPMWGKSLLIVQIFSWNDVEEAIEEFLAEISTESWEDAVKILTRYMDWEYEGM